MDVVGGVVLADGREAKILTGIDDLGSTSQREVSPKSYRQGSRR